MNRAPPFRIAMGTGPLPNNGTTDKVAEYFGEQKVNVVTHIWPHVDVDTPLAVHQIAHEDEAFVNHGDEGIRAAPPGVAVGDFFEEVRLFVEGLAANLDVHAEVRAHVEGRVNVDEL